MMKCGIVLSTMRPFLALVGFNSRIVSICMLAEPSSQTSGEAGGSGGLSGTVFLDGDDPGVITGAEGPWEPFSTR